MKTVQYYLMRHAAYYDFENQFVTYWGMFALKSSMDRLLDELKEKFPGKKLRVIHSALPRAKHTSLLMEDILKDIKVLRRSDPRLNSDKLQINEMYVREAVTACEEQNEICLILSHQPDIKHFCKKEPDTSQYIQMSIDIEQKAASSEESADDLPF